MKKDEIIFLAIYILVIIFSLMDFFFIYELNLNTNSLEKILTFDFSWVKNPKEIVLAAILFPIPFSLLAIGSIVAAEDRKALKKHTLISGLVGLFLAAIFLKFFGFHSLVIAFSLSYAFGLMITSYWSGIFFLELKSMRSYRATTKAFSKSMFLIRFSLLITLLLLLHLEPKINASIYSKLSDWVTELTNQLMPTFLTSEIEQEIELQQESLAEISKNISKTTGELLKMELAAKLNSENIDPSLKRELLEFFDSKKEEIAKKIENMAKSEETKEMMLKAYKERYLSPEAKEMWKSKIRNLFTGVMESGNEYLSVFKFLPIFFVLMLYEIISLISEFILEPLAGIYSWIGLKFIKA